MNTAQRTTGRTILAAIRAMLVLTVLLGIAYPLVMTGIGQLALPGTANGSLRTGSDGKVVGSSLIGQSFSDASGAPLPKYLQPRPSAAGDGYDAAASSGSNLGPENPELVQQIRDRKAETARRDGVSESAVPADAVTASSSGLDPHISPANAEIQVERIAEARGVDAERVRKAIASATVGPDLGFLGEARVNVLEANLALDRMKG